jgi:hypothetical protein
LNSVSAKAYRRSLSRLINQLTPNPVLQRTRSAPLRAPLSFETVGNPDLLGSSREVRG